MELGRYHQLSIHIFGGYLIFVHTYLFILQIYLCLPDLSVQASLLC
jgi:hypothetical protein